MSYTSHTLVQFGGKIQYASGTDVWSCGVRVIEIGPPVVPITDPAGYMAAIKTPLHDWFTAPASRMNAAATIEFLKVNTIDEDGHYADPTTTHQTAFAAGSHGDRASSVPYESCAVYSWETDVARGFASRGRIYPPNVYSLSDGELDSANRVIHATAGVALIDLLTAGATGGSTAVPSVFSKHGFEFHSIFACTVDNLPDRQSRRENAINSVRSRVAV